MSSKISNGMEHLPNDQSLNGNVIGSELIRNMELGCFEMAYAVLLPCVFTVFLNPADYAKLQGVLPLISEDSRQALRARVAELNRLRSSMGIRRKTRAAKEHKIACRDWDIEFLSDSEVPRGDVEIHSELSEVVTPGFRGTKTTLLGREPSVTQRLQERRSQTLPVNNPVYAAIHFDDDFGPQTYFMTTNRIAIGRGGSSEGVDLVLQGNAEISREHLVICRSPATGAFTITDGSTNGTWVNGKRLTKGSETILPAGAQIVLGETLTLLFEVRA